jgi:putative transposase
MSLAYLRSEQEILVKGVPYTLDRLIDDEWQLFDQKTKKAMHLKVAEMYTKYNSGEISFPSNSTHYAPKLLKQADGMVTAAHFDLYPEVEKEQMRRRRTFLEAYLHRYGDRRSQLWLRQGIEELWDKSWADRPHHSTVARWLKRYIEADKDIRALGLGNARKGNTKARYPLTMTEKCQQAIAHVYLQLERGSISATLEEARKLIRTENLMLPEGYKLPMPTKSYISALIRRIPEYERYAKRFGKTAAEHKFRKALHSTVASKPLQLVQIDHTQLDLYVVDSRTGHKFRPYLTVVGDVHSRAVLGFYLGHIPPSHMTVAKALKMAIMPKADIKAKWASITRDWPMFGCMENLRVDNGLEFHGSSLEAACYQLGINIEYCPRKKSWWKGYIERVIGELNRSVTDGMPGRTFANIKEKSDYNPVKSAAIPFETVEEMVALWIVDVYHQTVHSETGKTPQDAWESGIEIADIPLVSNIADLDAVMGVVESRKLTHRGIELNILRYHSEELNEVREKYGDRKLSLRWNPEDLGYIHLFIPDGRLLRVQVIPKYADYANGLTLHEHNACRELAKGDIQSMDEAEALSIAKAKMRQLAFDAIGVNKKQKSISVKRIPLKEPKNTGVSSPPVLPPSVLPALTALPRPKFAARSTTRINVKDSV